MSSLPEQAPAPFGALPPFASYAQLVRMLVPLADKIGFYDARGGALWISDGVEEPHAREQIERVLRGASAERPHAQLDRPATEPLYVLPIPGANGAPQGLISITCRDDRTLRNPATIGQLLAPLIDVLSHAWSPLCIAARKRPNAPADDGARATALPRWPALLRHALLLATERVECAFGAVLASTRPFVLSHRISEDQSDLDMNAAVEAIGPRMLRWLEARGEPVVANRASADRARTAPYKFLAYPLKCDGAAIAALILFRAASDRDFVGWDLEALADVCAQLPQGSLRELTPSVEHGARGAIDVNPPAQVSRVDSPGRSPVQPIITEARLRSALRHDNFDLHVQRIAPLRSAQEAARFEVLVRMHDAAGLLAPADFFEAARATGLMVDVDRWVVRRALETLRRRAADVRTRRLEFYINIAAQSLASDRFDDFLIAEVCRSGVPSGLLVFEFQESAALAHQAAVGRLCARLRDVGCQIALDNCRAGFGTLSTLRQWPISCVKLDGSLIGDLANPRSEAMLRAVVQLAGGAGVETVAQRVDSEALRIKLVDIGVDYAQGFHFDQPRPLETLFAAPAGSSG